MNQSHRVKSAFFTNKQDLFRGQPRSAIDVVYSHGRREKVSELTDSYPHLVGAQNFEEHVSALTDIDVIFSTWEMPVLSAEQVALMPNLKAVFYAAGATNYFRDPFLERGIAVCSGTAANAIPVAEYCLGHILLGAKGFFQNAQACQSRETMVSKPFVGRGVYGARVTLLGNGAISRKLQELLTPFCLEVQVIPSRALGERKMLEEVFEESYIISNHLPDLDDNAAWLDGDLFARMPYGATFINTGRGRQVNEAQMADVLAGRTDLTAILDVQYPEPPEENSPLYALPNVHITSHIAGTYGDEFVRIADYMIEEFLRWRKGVPLQYQVEKDVL